MLTRHLPICHIEIYCNELFSNIQMKLKKNLLFYDTLIQTQAHADMCNLCDYYRDYVIKLRVRVRNPTPNCNRLF